MFNFGAFFFFWFLRSKTQIFGISACELECKQKIPPDNDRIYPHHPSKKHPMFSHTLHSKTGRVCCATPRPNLERNVGPQFLNATIPSRFLLFLLGLLFHETPTLKCFPGPNCLQKHHRHVFWLRLLKDKSSSHFLKFRWITLAPHRARSETLIFVALFCDTYKK